MKRFTSRVGVVGVVGAMGSILAFSHPSYATENGDTIWPLGVQTVIPAILPPPAGTELYSYTAYYGANSYRDNRGNSSVPGFKLDNFIQAFRLVHTWDAKFENGVTLSSGAIASASNVKVKAFGNSDKDTGFRQLYITPLYISYSPMENLHLLTGFSAFIPLGKYDKNDLANSATGYPSYTQEFDLTWFPAKNWEISMAPIFTVNAKNNETDYRSGNVLNVDYLLGYRLESHLNFQLGLAGYITQQTTDDHAGDSEVTDGNRLRKFAIGPQLFYSFDQSSGVVLKWMHEASVRNGPKGDSLWVEFAFPL